MICEGQFEFREQPRSPCERVARLLPRETLGRIEEPGDRVVDAALRRPWISAGAAAESGEATGSGPRRGARRGAATDYGGGRRRRRRVRGAVGCEGTAIDHPISKLLCSRYIAAERWTMRDLTAGLHFVQRMHGRISAIVRKSATQCRVYSNTDPISIFWQEAAASVRLSGPSSISVVFKSCPGTPISLRKSFFSFNMPGNVSLH